jgi:hypothetical protein
VTQKFAKRRAEFLAVGANFKKEHGDHRGATECTELFDLHTLCVVSVIAVFPRFRWGCLTLLVLGWAGEGAHEMGHDEEEVGV